jgi:hypothetical protein
MSVTTPDGRTQELTAAESALATLALKDNSREIELRRGGPVDSKTSPSSKVSVPKLSGPTTQTES